MKALIVDDEQHVREAIRLLAEWEAQGIAEIYEAKNGEEAIELIQQHKPEIIFTDMKMPKKDGIGLLEWIKEHMPDSKTIVVTGYDDYHYMRKAIHFGSHDYLLKPVDPEILNQTLTNAVKEWNKEEAGRSKEKSSTQLLNEMKPVYRDRMLTKLFTSSDIKKEQYEELGFQSSGKYVTAVVKLSGKMIKNFGHDRDLAYFTVLNVINEVLSTEDCGIAFRYLAQKGQVAIILWDQFDQLEELLRRIYRSLKQAVKFSCPIAAGPPVCEISSLMDSYAEANEVLLSQNLLDVKEVRVYTRGDESEHSLPSLMAYAPGIELAVQAGEESAFDELIEEVTQEMTKGNFLSLRQLLHMEKEYQVICAQWLKRYNLAFAVQDEAEKQIEPFFDKDGHFHLEQYVDRKKREISIFLESIRRESKLEKKNIIYEIETYLQNNFDRDVKLQEIADQFYISREYISRKFKQEFGENISDYIVKYRIKKAKSLLKNSQLKVFEIANMVGYQDDKYFRKVFKKVEGITPNEYRQGKR
ncbi:AraC family transcriptional regulator [Mesobacillus campisalis]|uniref:AraC family transcriptional regulator n=1 Tax=Mesobacillus campisalis TaxID=1408103 RepID=A0A0M2SXF1_9BACI|nr:response regulator [Mesobacillus campisalis]KKK38833.1 AraC family transcriptional regulator [Mesobacillus campisalis]